MTEQQAARIIELLEGMQKTLNGLTIPKTVWDPEKKEYNFNTGHLSMNVQVLGEVEVNGSVRTY